MSRRNKQLNISDLVKEYKQCKNDGMIKQGNKHMSNMVKEIYRNTDYNYSNLYIVSTKMGLSINDIEYINKLIVDNL